MSLALNELPDSIHDALLKDMSVDYVNRIITLNIECYKYVADKARIAGSLIFEDVELFSETCNINELHDHTFTGHVNYLKQTNETTVCLYLVVGAISITSRKIYIK